MNNNGNNNNNVVNYGECEFFDYYNKFKNLLNELKEYKYRYKDIKVDNIILGSISNQFCLTFNCAVRLMYAFLEEYYKIDNIESLDVIEDIIDKSYELDLIKANEKYPDIFTRWNVMMNIAFSLEDDYDKIIIKNECHNIFYEYTKLLQNFYENARYIIEKIEIEGVE